MAALRVLGQRSLGCRGSLLTLKVLYRHLYQGTSVCQAAAIGAAMVLLYASRACYNLAALALAPRSRLDAFDYDWYNVSDQVGIGQVCPLSGI